MEKYCLLSLGRRTVLEFGVFIEDYESETMAMLWEGFERLKEG
jgi:hypothetical protein